MIAHQTRWMSRQRTAGGREEPQQGDRRAASCFEQLQGGGRWPTLRRGVAWSCLELLEAASSCFKPLQAA
eukprot:12982747-Alexandrium_andersonii.AAC.1